MATQPVKTVVRHVKPIVSTTKEEARARVISLYKAWYRQIPHSGEVIRLSFIFLLFTTFIFFQITAYLYIFYWPNNS